MNVQSKNMSPKTPNKFNEMRLEKQTLIMDVALIHFANEGYFKTTIKNIARHAGISQGLIYNYFESKEELLIAIINRSIEEISQYLPPDKYSCLSEMEFETFVRKFFSLLREKITFWRLLSQLLLQKDVREQFLKSKTGSVSSTQVMYTNRSNTFLLLLKKMITDYFTMKKERSPADYDADLEMNMFIYTIEGLARITITQDEVNEVNYQKAINKIIDLYK
jgi:AcrR family transcriptional regulator